MYEQERIMPYDGNGDKSTQVETMFDNIASTYDKLNHRLSWNIDKMWRNKAIKTLRPYNPQRILDIATGTGDLAILAAEMLNPQHITGADISDGMMQIGREKAKKKKLDNILSFERQDCMNLTYSNDSFDAVISAFGIRNFKNLEMGLTEMYRVLQKGGILCILELTTPVRFPMKQLFGLYSHTILPIYGRLISKDTSAYGYLTKSIEAFPQGEKVTELLQNIGFTKATFKRLTFGVCTLYIAEK